MDGKSAFNQRSFSKGLCKVGDLFELVCIKLHITELQLNVLDLLYLMGLYHSLPPEWKKLMARNKREMPLKTILYNGAEHSEVESLPSKKIYHLYISKISKPPTAKKKFEEQCASDELYLDWETIYLSPFKCAIEIKLHEFQYQVLHNFYHLMIFSLRLGRVSLLSVLSAIQQRKQCLICFFSVLCGTLLLFNTTCFQKPHSF